jgi:hypothetical protein
MKNDYLCPYCRGHLRVHEYIVFLARAKKEKKGLIFLSPEVGDYGYKSHPTFKIEKGKHVDFFCPICHANLAAKDITKNLARVIMVEATGTESILLFSEIAGEKCTYLIHENDVDAFGEDSDRYMNFFGESPRY